MTKTQLKAHAEEAIKLNGLELEELFKEVAKQPKFHKFIQKLLSKLLEDEISHPLAGVAELPVPRIPCKQGIFGWLGDAYNRELVAKAAIDVLKKHEYNTCHYYFYDTEIFIKVFAH